MQDHAYKVAGPVHAELVDPLTLERFEFEAKAGPVVPKSEQEEAALDHLVSLELATPPKKRISWPEPEQDDAAAEVAAEKE